jgi:hypothetical protein
MSFFPGNHDQRRPSRKELRHLRRTVRAMRYKAQGQGEKEKARRVSAMIHEQLKADNGVEKQYDAMQAQDALRAVDQRFNPVPSDDTTARTEAAEHDLAGGRARGGHALMRRFDQFVMTDDDTEK